MTASTHLDHNDNEHTTPHSFQFFTDFDLRLAHLWRRFLLLENHFALAQTRNCNIGQAEQASNYGVCNDAPCCVIC